MNLTLYLFHWLYIYLINRQHQMVFLRTCCLVSLGGKTRLHKVYHYLRATGNTTLLCNPPK